MIDDNSCLFPGDQCVFAMNSNNDEIYGFLDENCECLQDNTSIDEHELGRTLIKVIDMLGRKQIKDSKNTLLLHIYDDGSVEQKYLIK